MVMFMSNVEAFRVPELNQLMLYRVCTKVLQYSDSIKIQNGIMFKFHIGLPLIL